MQTYAHKTKKTAAAKPAPRTAAAPEITGNINLGGGRSLDLPEALRARVQSQFGFTPESIRVRESPEVADTGARAMAQGDTVSFAPGAFDPHTESGQELIGHELHHIAEQARGGQSANITGSNILFDTASESASDAAGRAFASGRAVTAAPQVTPVAASAAPVQGKWGKKKPSVAKMRNKARGDYKKFHERDDTLQGKFSKMHGSKTAGGIDSRQLAYIAGDKEGDELDNFLRIMGSSDMSEKSGVLDEVWDNMSNDALGFDESMLDEDYILQNVDKNKKLMSGLMAGPTLKGQKSLGYNMREKDNEIYEKSGGLIGLYQGYARLVMENKNKISTDRNTPDDQLPDLPEKALTEMLDFSKGEIMKQLPAYKELQQKYKPQQQQQPQRGPGILGKIGGGIASGAKAIGGGIASGAKAVGGGIKAGARGVGNIASSLGTIAMLQAQDTLGAIPGKIKSGKRAVKGAFGGLGRAAGNIGGGALGLLADGIGGAAKIGGGIASGAKKLGSGIASGARGIGKIASTMYNHDEQGMSDLMDSSPTFNKIAAGVDKIGGLFKRRR